jgi:phage I-like protein
MKVTARICSYRISNDALAGEALPARLKFLDWGNNATAPKVGETVVVNERTLAILPLTQAHEGWDRIALDYEHNTLKGTPEFERSQEPRAVAAYGVVRAYANDGLYLEDLVWTPHGKQFAREYCDLSPAPARGTDGVVIGVHSVALCRHGAIDGLSFYAVEVPTKGGQGMDLLKWVRGFTKAPETATEDDLAAGLTARIVALCTEAARPLVEKIAALEAQLAAGVKPEAITALSTEVAGLKAEHAAALLARDREAVLAQAARDGKVIALSADAVGKLSLEELKEHVSKVPVTVPLDRRTPTNIQALSVDADSKLTDLDRKTARMFGFSDDEVAKANGLKG